MVDARRQIAVGVAWTAMQKWLVRLASMVTFAVLSHLLRPADIGLAALAMAVVAVLGVIADMSAAMFLVQSRRWDETARSTIFWAGLVVGAAAMGVLLVTAGPLASLLSQPRIAPLIRVLSPLMLVYAVAAVPSAILQRELRFRELAIRETVATAVAAGVGIAAAMNGAGVWALVAQSLTQSTLAMVVVWAMSGWRPTRQVSREVLVEFRRFSAPLLAVNLMQSLRDRLEQFVLGAFLGAEALGLWTVATRLLVILADVSVAVLDVVALPAFAAARDTPARFHRTLESAMSSAQVLLVPALLALAITSPVVVPWAFGSQWTGSVVPAQILCVAYAIGGLSYFNRAALLSHGRSRVDLAVTGGFLAAHVVTVLLLARHGIIPLAWGSAVELVPTVIVGALVLRATLGVQLGTFVRGARVIGVGFLAAVPAVLVARLTTLGPVAEAAVGLAAAAVVFAAGLWLTNRRLVREVVADVRRVASRAPAR